MVLSHRLQQVCCYRSLRLFRQASRLAVKDAADSHMICDGVFLRARQDKNNRETNGFKSRMGAAAPRPRLLRLRPEDAAKVGGAPMRQGKFTWVTEAGRQERWIVASCGNHTVLWNFRCALGPRWAAAARAGRRQAGLLTRLSALVPACPGASGRPPRPCRPKAGRKAEAVCRSWPSGACGRPPSAPPPGAASLGRALPGLSDPGRRPAACALTCSGARGAGR